jgi:hypothetical protein
MDNPGGGGDPARPGGCKKVVSSSKNDLSGIRFTGRILFIHEFGGSVSSVPDSVE